MLNTDELLVALAMTRTARDHLARQLPVHFVQDTPEQMALLQRLNMVLMQLSVTAAEMAQLMEAHMTPVVTLDIAPGFQR